jgi:hypothetical protein
MSDHFDLLDPLAPDPNKAPLDIGDLYAFQSPGDPTRSALILTVNPLTLGPAFDPNAVYRINVDTDEDARADLAFSVVFSPPERGRQQATVYRAAGDEAREPEATGDVLFHDVEVSAGPDPVIVESDGYRFFAGVRSEPFFADVDGLLHEFQFTGTDFFGDKNVFAIALEVPNEAFASGASVGVWGRTSLRQDGRLVPVDRIGGPGVTNFLHQTQEEKRPYMEGEPAEDRAVFGERFAPAIEHMGFTADEARDMVEGMLPDVLRYDPSRPAGYPNGRLLSDDVLDLAVSMVTHGTVPGDGVGPHDDYLAEFPFLGPPHPST